MRHAQGGHFTQHLTSSRQRPCTGRRRRRSSGCTPPAVCAGTRAHRGDGPSARASDGKRARHAARARGHARVSEPRAVRVALRHVAACRFEHVHVAARTSAARQPRRLWQRAATTRRHAANAARRRGGAPRTPSTACCSRGALCRWQPCSRRSGAAARPPEATTRLQRPPRPRRAPAARARPQSAPPPRLPAQRGGAAAAAQQERRPCWRGIAAPASEPRTATPLQRPALQHRGGSGACNWGGGYLQGSSGHKCTRAPHRAL